MLHLSEPKGFRWHYNAKQDRYIVPCSSDGQGEAEVFSATSISVDGQQITVYPIGVYSWIRKTYKRKTRHSHRLAHAMPEGPTLLEEGAAGL